MDENRSIYFLYNFLSIRLDATYCRFLTLHQVLSILRYHRAHFVRTRIATGQKFLQFNFRPSIILFSNITRSLLSLYLVIGGPFTLLRFIFLVVLIYYSDFGRCFFSFGGYQLIDHIIVFKIVRDGKVLGEKIKPLLELGLAQRET